MTDYRSHTDQELAALLKSGDKAAYTEIYERYFPLLYIHAYKKLGKEEDAKDLLQELFTVLWYKRSEINQNNLAAYLYTAVRNRVLDIYAHQQVTNRYILSFQNYIDTVADATDYLIRERELSALIEKEIQVLPTKMREVFELSRKSNLTHKEIAEQLHISEQTVAKQITNALKTLRVKLGIFAFILMIIGP